MSKQLKADIFLLFITIIWGVSFVLIKDIIEEIPSFAYLTIRFALAFLILSVVYRKHFRKMSRKTIGRGFIIALMLFLGMSFQITGLKYTTASNSALIMGFNVILVPVISGLFLKKKPEISSIAGVLMAGCGIFILSGGINLKFNIGDVLTLICAVGFAMQIIFVDMFANEENAIGLGVLQIGFTALLSAGMWLKEGIEPFAISRELVITLVITSILGTALAYVGQVIVQRFTSPTHTALIFTAEPVFGLIAALFIPDSNGVTETLTMRTVFGCILVPLGMLASEFDIKIKNMFYKIKKIILYARREYLQD